MAPMKISAINDADVHRITSGQVIVDLTSAVKELLDNSIDSGADHVECTFKNYGMESLECSDNGSGIAEDNYETLALKHYTSKITSFEDVSQVRTLGFRGEALSSLAAIANLVVTTTTNPPKAARLEYNFKGELSKRTVTSRNKGTTVQVSHLFNNLPVRKKDFTRNHKRQFNKCIALLQAYTIIQDHMKISVWHITSNGRKSLVLSSTIGPGIPKRIIGVFGSSAMQGIADIQLVLQISPVKSALLANSDYAIKVAGYISKNSFGCGRSAKDRQFVYINRRPVVYPALVKCCNEVYRTFNNVQYPAFYLDFEILPEFIDINVTPDKRTVLLHSEEYVVDALRNALTDYYSDQEMVLPVSGGTTGNVPAGKEEKEETDKIPKEDIKHLVSQELDCVFQRDDHDDGKVKDTAEDDYGAEGSLSPEARTRSSRGPVLEVGIVQPKIFVEDSGSSSEENVTYQKEDLIEEVDLEASGSNFDSINEKREAEENENVNKRQKTLDLFVNPSQDRSPNLFIRDDNNNLDQPVTLQIGDERIEERAIVTRDNRLIFSSTSAPRSPCCSSHSDHEVSEDEGDDIEMFERHDSTNNDHAHAHAHDHDQIEEVEHQMPPVELNQAAYMKTQMPLSRGTLKACIPATESKLLATSINVDYSALIAAFRKVKDLMSRRRENKPETHYQKNEELDDFEKGENYLTLTVSKSDFRNMNVVGQFNLGFIIVTRKIAGKFDLFIVDQHASDEKYNFETLQRTTVFRSQRLIAPQVVEMSVIDELIAMDNMSVFEKNGFKLEIDEDQPQGCRIKLAYKPPGIQENSVRYE